MDRKTLVVLKNEAFGIIKIILYFLFFHFRKCCVMLCVGRNPIGHVYIFSCL